ncbi:chromosome segregation protein SMC [Aquibacillus sediminis]|uniref:chromosome segregation protein SMC n=1 Tax=Aquibacillus sediminis TaxID=2574734 RepID=UPI001109B05F|nr:chromosome segregation protein SMC [Aquibacillus sediminis]
MFLKRLDSVGFKSFAERISVDFVPGVTAVVGPNGSGKSNITDAIRWVLGEQSARSLRGAKMEDIIFQGSDSRKPLNVAEVTLTLDNSDHVLPVDYEEISVTRRVYRSGESEFLINKQACRLKDIIDLFMDSGLGREAFSIISQGKVEEILSSKADERRSIFEEAAGVLKYKNRKKKAEYKLAETQENLNRIEDIIYEIESQLDPLKEQASVAKDYLAKKDELKEQEISLLITEIEQLYGEWKSVLEEVEKQKQKELQHKTKIQTKQAKVEEERAAVQALDEQVEKLQDQLVELTKELETLEGNKKLINERFRHFEENKTKLEQEEEQLQTRISTVEHQLQTQQQQLQQLIDNRDRTKHEASQVKDDLNQTKQNISEQIEDLKSEYIELLNQQAAKKNERQSIEQQLNQMEHRKNNQQDKFQNVIAEREKVDKEIQDLQVTFEQTKLERQTTDEKIQSANQQLERDKSTYQELQTKLYQGYQYIEKLKSKKEMLEDMKEDFQGFFQGVKEILKAREEQKLHGIDGAVIELVDVPSSYITAIETALGGQAQHIIVDNEAVARKSIQWLKQSQKGRATFLPLSAIKPKYISNELLTTVREHQGFVGVASDLIDFSDRHQHVIKSLLGNVVIANTLKDANEIASKLLRRFRVVTLEGDVVNPGGSMSGGFKKKTNQSLFTREKDLTDITDKLDQFEQKAKDFERKVNHHKQIIADREVQIDEWRNELKQQQSQEHQAHSNLMEAKARKHHINENLKVYDQDKEQYEKDYHLMQDRSEKLIIELKQLDEKLSHTQSEIDLLTKQQNDYQQNQEQLQQQHHKLQVTLAEQEAQVQNQQEKTNTIQTSLQELQQSLHDNQKQLQQMKEWNKNGETEAEISEKVQQKQLEKDETVESIQSKRQERANRTQYITDEERELKELNRIQQLFIQTIQEKEVQANRYDVELENRLSRLQDEYTITYEKAQDMYPKSEDIESTRQSVKLIKRSIDELGTVNLGAIEEYERIEERYQFMTTQQADLIQAKETLYGVIAEMDDEMVRRFSSTFNQIKEEFSVVFEQLFGGGKAELKLTDPDHLLETGVEISAQPPGKKLQHLGLLSGGERALTAIALLFAILRVRPVPFCVLDEVEAALDEANVNRFARYLKDYSKNTQFIVITHRKGTMEEADVLYGVTMQESGVSRLVSVRLEETNELVNA